MTITGVPTELLDINSDEAPCEIEIQFSADGRHLWVHMNGTTIVRIYGVGRIKMTNAYVDGQRQDLTWDA